MPVFENIRSHLASPFVNITDAITEYRGQTRGAVPKSSPVTRQARVRFPVGAIRMH